MQEICTFFENLPPLVLNILWLVVALVVIIAFVSVCAIVLVYGERKVAGFVQRRPGPYEVGPQGIIQPVCDAVKLMFKQIVRPTHADPGLFYLAPVLSFFPVLLLFLPIPFGEFLTGLNVNLGILLILAFSGINVIAVLLAGLASNNKYGLLGAARGVSQSVAYEIPLLLSVLAIAMMTGTLSFSEVVAKQGGWPWQWNVFTQPVAFLIFIISAFGETNRAPFDLPEGESELTGGFHTEYSGMGFGLFFLAEYANMVLVCAVATALFLGGYKGPFLDGPWWFMGKVSGLIFLMMWVRWTYPRLRFDQMLNLNWKWLLPLGVLNLLGTAFAMKFFPMVANFFGFGGAA
ncbi:NADH-quinone oxidoreductase subunit H 1 [uncultured delta proteobacterium]|uniref:NADH-quinone oxidoreductase subunit H n=1 Tax=uncultured delta proteobacterium TaxID=34034 RepID=A0A212JYT2_9DELT|nr:NADH-quinone oxidoreductase subunit H 1 [uncultured delta proteobacterium]